MVRLDTSTTAGHVQIGSVQGADAPKTVKSQNGVAQPISAGTVAGGSAADAASVSSAGSAVAQATAGSDVRMDKVAALQAAIANGTYKVSAGAVADKLIASLLGGR